MIFDRLLAKNFCTFTIALCAFASALFAATAPLVRLTAPADNVELTLRTVVRGEVSSSALASWQLLAAPAGTVPDDLPRWTQLAAGTQNTQGELGGYK